MLQGEQSAILSIFIKLPYVIKIFVSSIFEWPFKTGFTVFVQSHQSLQFAQPIYTTNFDKHHYKDFNRAQCTEPTPFGTR